MKKVLFACFCLFLTVLSATALDLPEAGKYYRFYSGQNNNYDRAMYEIPAQNKMTCAAPVNVPYMLDIWEITSDNKLRNVVSGNYVQGVSDWSAVYATGASNGATFVAEVQSETDILFKFGSYYANYNTGQGVLSYWDLTNHANWWRYEEVTLDNAAITAARAEYQEYVNGESAFQDRYDDLNDNKGTYGTAFAQFFDDEICTELKSQYQSMTDEQLRTAVANAGLPKTFQDIALKVKNTWSDETDGDISAEFRVQEYGAYSAADPWRWNHADTGRGLNASQINDMCNPTGIYTTGRDILTVYVSGDVPAGCQLRLSGVYENPNGYDYNNYNNGTTLTRGLNFVPASENLHSYWLMYSVTDKFKKPAEMPKLTVHIEGGHVMGYVNTQGLDETACNTQYEKVLKAANASAEASGAPKTQLRMATKGNYGMCLWQIDTYNKIWSDQRWNNNYEAGYKIYKSIRFYDNALYQEWCAMGIMKDVHDATAQNPVNYAFGGEDWYPTYCNNLAFTIMGTVGGSPHSSTGYTHMPGISAVESSFNGERENFDVWCVAHESGHNNQGAINLESSMEVSNNFFSNIVTRLYGYRHTRGGTFTENEANFANNVVFGHRDIGMNMRMYYNLWLYYHYTGHKMDFYPTLFTSLRYDPMQMGTDSNFNDGVHGNARRHNATTTWLKFYKKACEAAQEDLTEYFRLWGFFVPCENEYFGDYSSYYVTCTQADIDAAIAWVKAQNWPENLDILFIEDRQEQELRTDPWADGSQNKPDNGNTARTDDYLHNTYGTLGNITDFTNGTTAGNYTYTKVGQTVTLNGSGGVGFVFKDSEGNVVYHANSTSVTLPENVVSKVASVDVVNTNGTTAQLVNTTSDAELRTALSAIITTANAAYLNFSDDTGNRVGYYKASDLTTLQQLVTEGQSILDNNTVAQYESQANAIRTELDNIRENVSVQMPKANGIYRIQNVVNNQRYAYPNNDEALKATDNTELEETKWQFTKLDNGNYLIQNYSTKKYVTATTNDNGVVTAWLVQGASSENGLQMKLKSCGNGQFYVKDSSDARCFNLDGADNHNICSWSEDNNSKWNIVYVGATEEPEPTTPYIDYLVVYDQNAKTWIQNNSKTMQSHAEDIVASLNQCMANSHIDGRYRLAGYMEVNTTAANCGEGLAIGYRSDVIAKKAEVNADMVCVLIEHNAMDGQTGSSIQAAVTGIAEDAICAVRCSSSVTGFVAAHETAHVMGCNHSRRMIDAGQHEYAVACEYGRYRTLLSSGEGTETDTHLLMLSGPGNYAPDGVTEMGSATEDNARMVRETWNTVAAFSDASNNYQLATHVWEPSASAQNTQIAITTSTFYYLQSSADWLTVTDPSGYDSGYGNGNLQLSVTANTNSEPRTATITIEGQGSTSIFVTQAGSGGASEYTVTYNYKYNNELIDTEDIVVTVGSNYPAPTKTFDFADTFNLPEGQVNHDETVNFDITFTNFPFEFSESFANATWYKIKMRDNKYAYYDASNQTQQQTPTNTTASTSNEYLWAFVGNPIGFKIINKAAGDGKYLKKGDSDVKNELADGAFTEYVAVYDTHTYDDNSRNVYIKVKNTDNCFFNLRENHLAYWDNGSAKGEIGSALGLIEVEIDPLLDAALAKIAEGETEYAKTQPGQLVQTNDTKLITQAAQLYCNAPDESEGQHIEYLIDENASTFFHSSWHTGYQALAPHYLRVNLPENSLTDFCLKYTDRTANDDHIKTMKVYGSNDGENYSEELATVNLPTHASGATGEICFSLGETPYTYYKFAVTDCAPSYRTYFHSAEFQLYQASHTQPEYECSDEKAAALRTAIDALQTKIAGQVPLTQADIDAVTAAIAQVTADPSDNFVEGQVYRIMNQHFSGDAIFEQDNHVCKATTTIANDDASQLWSVTSAAGNGQAPYYFRNLNTGRYLQRNNDGSWSTIGAPAGDAQKLYLVFDDTNKCYAIAPNETAEGYVCAHIQSSQYNLVSWVSTGAGSRWLMTDIESVSNYDVYNVVVNGLDDASAATVSTSNVTPVGKTTLGHGEAFYFTHGTSVTSGNFTASEVQDYRSQVVVENNTITVTYTKAKNLVFFNFTDAASANQTIGRYTVAVAPASGNLTTGTATDEGGDNFALSDAQIQSLNDNVLLSENGFTVEAGRSWIGAELGNGKHLNVTVGGLTAGNSYNVSFVTGRNFEGAGTWNNVTTTNTVNGTSTPAMGSQSVAVRALTPYIMTDVVADANGEIKITVNTAGKHSAVINCLSISGDPVYRYTVAANAENGGVVYNESTYTNGMSIDVENTLTLGDFELVEVPDHEGEISLGEMVNDAATITVTYSGNVLEPGAVIKTVEDALNNSTTLTADQLKALASNNPTAHWAMTPVSDNAQTKNLWMGCVAEKISNLTTDYLFNLVTNDTGWSIQRVSDGQFLNGSTSTLEFVNDMANGLKFNTIAAVTPSDYASQYAELDKIRFTTTGTNYLNSQGANTVGKLANGTGGFSAYVCFGPFYVVNATCLGPNDEDLGVHTMVVTSGSISAPEIPGYISSESVNVTEDTNVTFHYQSNGFAPYTVTSKSQFDGTFVTTFSTAGRGSWTTNTAGTNVVSTAGSESPSAEEANQKFVVMTLDGGYRIYNVATKKFVNRTSNGKAELVAGMTNAWDFDEDNNTLVVKVEGGQYYFNFGGSSQVAVDTWTAHDAGNKLTVQAIEAFSQADYDEAVEIYWSSIPTTFTNVENQLTKTFGTGLSEYYLDNAPIDNIAMGTLVSGARTAWNGGTLDDFIATNAATLTGNGYTATRTGLVNLCNDFVNAVKLNMPQPNTFLRIKANPNHKENAWLSSANTTTDVKDPVRAAFVDNNSDANTILFYNGTNLVSYTTGKKLINNTDGSGFPTWADGVADGATVTFGVSNRGNGLYTITTANSRYMFTNANMYTDAGNNANADGYTFVLESVDDLPVTLSQVGDSYFATLYLPNAATVEGADVYVGTANGSYMHMTRSEDGIVPALQGVVLNSIGSSATVHLNNPDTELTSDLTGVLELTTIVPDNVRVFTAKKNTEKVGFYKLSGVNTVKAFRAYYEVPAGNTRDFDLFWDETTGLTHLNTVKVNAGLYDLQGRKVNEMKNGNLYIKQGKKVLK